MGVRRRGRSDRAQVARVPLPPDSVSAAGDRRRGRHRHARDARDGARVSRQRAHPRATKRSSCAATRCSSRPSSSRAARSRSRCRPARGTTSISRQRFPGRRVLRYKAALDQFPVFGREGYALPLGPAVQHTGEIDPAKPLEQLWVFGRPTRPLAGLLQAKIVEAGGRHLRDRRGRRRQGRALRRRVRPSPSPGCRGDRMASTLAITAGEPAGIGPELIAQIALRHRERPFAARLVVIGDRELLRARAARIGLAPRYADYDPASSIRAASGDGTIEVWHQPTTAPGDARTARSCQRAQRARDARSAGATRARPARSTRSSRRRCRRAC